MRRVLLLITSLLAGFALLLPALTTPAQASAPGVAAESAPVLAKKKAKFKVSLKRSAKGSHVGQPGVKVTAKVKRGKKNAGGKVTFYLGKKKLKKVRLKKGKAKVRLPRNLAPGTYTVKAKYGRIVKKTKVKVYDSAVRLSGTEFVVSKSTDSFDQPSVTGTVKFRGKTASKGYVDVYQDGRVKDGRDSAFYCCFASVADDGTFELRGSTFLGRVADEKPVGTYKYQAFYTPTPSFSEYIYSSVITVTVTE